MTKPVDAGNEAGKPLVARRTSHRANAMMSERDARLLGDERAQMIFTDPRPVARVADVVLDCSHRNVVILDPFGGAGTTLIATRDGADA